MFQIRDVKATKIRSFDHIILFLLLYLTSSYYKSILNAGVAITVCFFVSLFVFVMGKRTIQQGMLSYAFLLSANILISFLAADDPMNRMIYNILSIYSALLYVSSMDKERFAIVYSDIMAFIAAFSIITYMLANFTPGLITLFPRIVNSEGYTAYNMLFSTVRFYTYNVVTRNQGIFWEPGVYQTYLAFAFLFELFARKSPRRWAIYTYIVAFITSQSTTGIYVMILLILIYFIKDFTGAMTKTAKVVMSISLIIAAFYIIYPLLPANYQYTILGKIQAALHHDDNTITTGSVRWDSIIYPLQSFFQSPIIGVGFSGLQDWSSVTGHMMNTCTPLNWFAAYGIIYGIIHVYGIYKLARSFKTHALIAVLIIITLLISLSTEQYVGNMSILLFVFYGLAFYDDLLKESGSLHKREVIYGNR